MPDDATEGVVEHNSRLQPSINLHAPVTAFMFSCCIPMYYPKGIKARVSPVQSIEPRRILVPTWDLIQGPLGPESRVVITILPLHF